PFVLRFLKTKKVYYCEEPLRIVYDPYVAINPHTNRLKNMYEKSIRLLRKYIDKKNIANADLVLANSYFTKENIFQAYGINATVNYLGVDTDFFKPLREKKKFDILFIGERDAVDGYFLFEKVMKNLSRTIKVKM